MKDYQPCPIDTSSIQLPDDLARLTERLAQNVHEVWSAERMAEGWVWGTQRNDILKTHPCLVPYEQLPESEKDYDRATAMQTVKTILTLGYNISKS